MFIRLAATFLAASLALSAADNTEFFEKQIRPVLVAECYSCHSGTSKPILGGLRLDSRQGLLRGGASGVPAVVPGKAGESLLLKAISGTLKDLKMPPGKALSPEVVQNFTQWVEMGAPDPREQTNPIPASSASGPYDWAKERRHWAYQPIRNPAVPVPKDPRFQTNPIDRFVRAKLEEKGLSPVGTISKRQWLRRVTYDLVGLPPTPAEVQAFDADLSPGAKEKVVDRLLASPAYGEHWGRHWMDVVRYADTAGCNSDFPVPAAYRYRNYIIHSLNNDKPYTDFVREQIAGDLLEARDSEDRVENIVATGYLAGARRFASNKREHHLTIDDTIDNLGKAFLGLSVSCARCHDHKFDPIPQKDYYALYGIFESTHYAFPGVELFPRPNGFTPIGNEEQKKRLIAYETEMSAIDEKLEALRIERPAPMGKRTKEEIDAERAVWREKQRQAANRFPNVPKAYAVWDAKPVNARVQIKGDPATKGPEVPRGFLTILGGQRLPEGSLASGRRELAGWILDPANPLTLRVIVNRVWQWHFGKGLVQTPNDFGVRGEAPTHPELLDHLATWFAANGQSLKKLHKYLVLTRVYELDSTAPSHLARNHEKDPRNDFLWRFERRRLSAEEIRDSILAASGTLDRSMGSEHPFPPEPTWTFTQHRQFFATYPTDKRSVYVMQQRQRKHPWFETWDGADTNASSAVRPISTTAIQALTLMNDPFVHEEADRLAVKVFLSRDTDQARLDFAWRTLYGRAATPAELLAAQRHLAKARASVAVVSPEADRLTRQSWASLMRVLLASDEFLYVD